MTTKRTTRATWTKRFLGFFECRIPLYRDLFKILWMMVSLAVRAPYYRGRWKSNPKMRLKLFDALVRLECRILCFDTAEDEYQRDAWRRLSAYSAVRARALRQCGARRDEREKEEYWASETARIAREFEGKIQARRTPGGHSPKRAVTLRQHRGRSRAVRRAPARLRRTRRAARPTAAASGDDGPSSGDPPRLGAPNLRAPSSASQPEPSDRAREARS